MNNELLTFEDLPIKGKICSSIVLNKTKDAHSIIFTLSDGEQYIMHHSQDCCEDVAIQDICGSLLDLVGEELLVAEVCTKNDPEAGEVGKWTFYRFSTKRGSVTIRWYGSSNGYYSVEVDFVKYDPIDF